MSSSTDKSPRIIVLANCVIKDIYDPIRGYTISKSQFGFIVVAVDFLVVVAFFVFIYCLSSTQKTYVNMFRDQTIEMTDFSISISNLPLDDMYEDKEEVLRAYLTHHYEGVLKDRMIRDGICGEEDIDS